MLFLVTALFALVVALVLTGIFFLLLRNRGPWSLWWAFFLVVFLGALAGGVWAAPFGPALFDVYWLPILISGLIFALLLAAASPRRSIRRPVENTGQPAPAREEPYLSYLFWVLLTVLFLVIIIAYT
jgi:hypothetical protein